MSRFFERFFFPGWVIHPVILFIGLLALVAAGMYWLI